MIFFYEIPEDDNFYNTKYFYNIENFSVMMLVSSPKITDESWYLVEYIRTAEELENSIRHVVEYFDKSHLIPVFKKLKELFPTIQLIQ